jgi:hypothetical protein
MAQYKELPLVLNNLKPNVLPIEHSLRQHAIPHTSFVDWLRPQNKLIEDARKDDLCEYLDHLEEESAIESLLAQSVRETFYLLFGNRKLLLLFNKMMADQISSTP